MVWELELACGHKTRSEVRYSDADGPADKGPHMAPRNHLCPYGCKAPELEPSALPLWPWAALATALVGVLLWLMLR